MRHEAAAPSGPNGTPSRGELMSLGDTGLSLRVDEDDTALGHDLTIGFGKTVRDGIALQAATVAETCDIVITGAVVLDAIQGVRKTDVGIRAGRISGLGRAGNPDTMDGIDIVIGTGTTVIPGEGLILTAGAVDTHVHLLSPRILEASLASGVTTVIGQEFGPVWGVGVNSPWALQRAFAAFDAWPVNIGFLGRGSSSRPGPLLEALEGGACGFKVHEDFGAHRTALDTALTVAEEYDVQVALHTDGLNECLSVEDTLAVTEGRTFHAFHIEGCGGGHTPNVLRLAGEPNVIGSSTNPTLPFGRDASAEHFAMIVAVHGLAASVPSEAALARDRIRESTMGAENILHDLGAIAITSSDAQGMGRAGETVRRTFALAGTMKAARGAGRGGEIAAGNGSDNERALRYIAKLTINPAIAHGLAHEVGSVEVGKLADLVLWDPRWFGAKPDLVLKAGFPAWGLTGDPNASHDRCEPLVYGPQFGGHGAAPAELSVAFVSQAAMAGAWQSRRRRVAVRNCRGIGPADMVRNARLGQVRVDDRGRVTLDGEHLYVDPVSAMPLHRLYFL